MCQNCLFITNIYIFFKRQIKCDFSNAQIFYVNFVILLMQKSFVSKFVNSIKKKKIFTKFNLELLKDKITDIKMNLISYFYTNHSRVHNVNRFL